MDEQNLSLPYRLAEQFSELTNRCIFLTGKAGTGKTTFLNALSDHIPADERVITVEDSAELQFDMVSNLVRMECRNANSTGTGAVTLGALIKASLRMRPDRLIVGEVRGSEVVDMLQALNTGHSGMSTGHGNNVRGMLRRLEAMYLGGVEMPVEAIRAQITEALDVIVHLERMRDGKRRVVEVSEVADCRDGRYEINPIFILKDGKELVATGNALKNDMKLKIRERYGHGEKDVCGNRCGDSPNC